MIMKFKEFGGILHYFHVVQWLLFFDWLFECQLLENDAAPYSF
jgi:hypothetical protein